VTRVNGKPQSLLKIVKREKRGKHYEEKGKLLVNPKGEGGPGSSFGNRISKEIPTIEKVVSWGQYPTRLRGGGEKLGIS